MQKKYWITHHPYFLTPDQDSTDSIFSSAEDPSSKKNKKKPEPNWKIVFSFLKTKDPAIIDDTSSIVNTDHPIPKQDDKNSLRLWHRECIADTAKSLSVCFIVAILIYILSRWDDTASYINQMIIHSPRTETLYQAWKNWQFIGVVKSFIRYYLLTLMPPALIISVAIGYFAKFIESKTSRELDPVQFWSSIVSSILASFVLHIYYRIYWHYLKGKYYEDK